MNEINVTQHKCKGKCPEFKGEQCGHCLISDSEIPNELPQTEVAHLNAVVERLKTEMVAMQARKKISQDLLQMMQGDEEYICTQCDMLGDEA